ncbi:MAG: helix-turn-helix domain-containing protein [Bacteroides sp.]|jgi:transcriptional regulator with XRE-family HTH domain|nr:helix-turn-helix domain-containing protein [Bacteroides sp.]
MNERTRIGIQLKDYRTKNKLTVRQLADLSGVSYQNITKIENGKYNVSIDILEKITKALDVSIEIIEK